MNTSSSLVWLVTGILSPVVVPDESEPIAKTPVSAGASVTTAPGTAVKALFGVAELYRVACMVTVDPIRDSASVVLKKAEILVIVPLLGIEKAKFVNVPAALVKSMIPPDIDKPAAELPIPIKAGSPTNPPAMVVKVTGLPDA